MAAKRYATADDSSTRVYPIVQMLSTVVQPPSEWFWSIAGNGFVAVSATSGGSKVTGFPISILY